MAVALWMIVGAAFGAWTGWAAVDRNRSAVGWWATGVALGPIGLLLLYTRPRGESDRVIL